ncbi:hypothetical protein HTG_04355 [Natrinema mahii]|nr:hypothetical protein HTG_04355 [Natrinema mahii]
MSAHRPIAHRAFTVLLAFLLVGSAVAPIGATQPAAAQSSPTLPSGCTTADFLSFSGGVGSCPTSFLNQEINDLQDANDIYNYGLNGMAGTEAAFTFFDNYLNDTRSPARMRMQVAVSQAYQNGSSEIKATSDARAAVTEYYTVKEENLLRTYNTSLHLADGMVQRTETSGFDPKNTTRLVGSSSEGYSYSFTGSFRIVGSTTVELGDNSTTVQMPVMETTLGSIGTHSSYGKVNVTSTARFTLLNATDAHTLQFEDTDGSETGSFDMSFTQINLRHAVDPATYPKHVYLDVSKFENRRSTITDQRDEMLNYSESFVSNTWSAYEEGRINANDVVSRLTQLEGFSQDAVGENATMDDVVVALSSMGLATPDLNSTGYMSVEFTPEAGSNPDPITQEGMLLSSSSPESGSWSANTTYTPNEIENSTPLMMATDTGEQYTINASENVTLYEIVDTDGDNVENTTTDELPENYDTVDTAQLISDLNTSLQRIEELEQQKQENEEQEGGIGLPSIGLPEAGGAFVGLVVIGVAVLAVIGIVTRGGRP